MKVDRRSFVVGALSGVVAACVGVPTELAASEISLPAVRDMLLPGLWSVTSEHGSDYESDIMVDFKADALIVKVYRFSTKQELGFAMLRPSIQSGRYKREFKPTLDRLFQVIAQV